MMETSLKLKPIGFKNLRFLFFSLLISLQIHLLVAVPQDSVVVSGHENNFSREPKMSRKLSFSINVVGKHDTTAIERIAANGGDKGGQHGVTVDAGGRKTKLSNKRGGALIPVYTAGAVNSNRRHRQQTQHHSGTSSDTINRIASSRLVLVIFTSFCFVYT
ncbi:Putative sodium-coupled neutral amino acid transporter 10 [Gossypium arboreum]|uniref:Putative sodium-coupled neutral amino acid transporter 10 n=1 Tax=Gossypium arboreum TaxID=29729 RepID=A0A0B0P8D6_GOSAR|nr:Putative sodium-coupled neutral amino acid transporter 10 [Gossypium arboreum]